MKTSIKIGKIYGIPVKLHFTLIFIVIFIAWSIGSNVFLISEALGVEDPGIATGPLSYLIGFILAMGLFISVFIHEMAHSIVSIRNGIKVEEISLWLFGGVSSMEEMPNIPNVEIKVSAVGPLTSLAIGIIMYTGGMLLTDSILVFMFIYLGLINFILAGFNLIPAFPMDGGRILRAFLAKKLPYVKATKKAADIGKAFAIIFGIVGFFFNIFLILIAFFVYIAASQEAKSVMFRETLSKVKVKDIMSKDVKTVSPDTSIKEFLDMVTTYQHTGFPVASEDKILGIMTLGDSKKIPEDRISVARVKDVMEKDIICVNPEDDVNKVWKLMMEKQFGRFPVLEGDDLVGIITRSDVMQSFNILTELERFGRDEI
ncbi:MAG: CBS domain-containing protein [Thermoplasmatota archaeon]